MNNIQFCHKRKYKLTLNASGSLQDSLLAKGGVTAALDLSDVAANKDSMKEGDVISVKVALAICSDDDNYNRKIGRNIALGRLAPRPFKVKQTSEKYIILENCEIEFTILISGVHLRFVSVE